MMGLFAWFGALPLAKKLLYGIGALVALLGAITALILAVHHYNESLRQDGRNEVQAKWDREKAVRATALAEFQVALGAALQPRFDALAQAIGSIDAKAATVNVALPKALAADPRYTSKDCGLTDPVRDQVNAARASSGGVQ